MKTRAFLFALILTLLAAVALAAPTSCPQHYLGGQAPDIVNAKLSPKTQEVCYKKFALLHSGITRTPLFAAEHLTKEALIVDQPPRKDTFHADPNLAPADRAEVEDYDEPIYDRGHLAPAGDMPDKQSQHESFSLANMVPQNKNNNRQLWRAIEATTREMAISSGELYVISGPIFVGSELARLNGRVLIPTHIFKAIYDPQQKQAAAYLVKNAPGKRYAVVPLAEVEQLTGLSLFPGLPGDVQPAALDLPQPKARGVGTTIKDNTLVPQKPVP